jgi:hypothetical protein
VAEVLEVLASVDCAAWPVKMVMNHKAERTVSPENRTFDSPSPPQLCGSLLGARAHVCAFFRDTADRHRTLLPFIQAGLAAGEKVVQTVSPAHRAENLQHLSEAGIDCASALAHGFLHLYDWTETHLNGGTFEAARTLTFFRRLGEQAAHNGFPRTRFVTEMEWALQEGVAPVDLLAYEAEANRGWLGGDQPVNPVICTYDMSRFSPEFLVQVMRTHPLTLVDGLLQENPFFVPPEQFVLETRAQHELPAIAARW